MMLESGHEVHTICKEEEEERAKIFIGKNMSRYIKLTPGDWIFLEKYQDIANTLYNFEVNYISCISILSK